jgi:raffinose/stachyose/melibiose transport system substrate-binding protein
MLGNSNPPDIFFSWVGEYGEKFVRDNKALDLTKYVQEDTAWSSQIIASQFKSFTFNDKTYGVPFFMDSKLFYYNKDIFAKLNLQPPATWSEFMTTLQALKESGTTPIQIGNKAPWAAAHYITALNQRVVSADTIAKDQVYKQSAFTDGAYTEALEKLNELLPYFNENPNAIGHEEARNLFINGKAAMIYLETLELPYMDPAKFEWGTFSFPSIEGGKGDQTGLIGAPEGFMISKNSKHPEEAMKFLKFLTSKAMGEKLVKDTGLTSVVNGTTNEETASPKGIEMFKMIEEADNMALWLDTAIDAQIFKAYGAGVQQMLNKQDTPESVMKHVQEIAKQVRNK